jgi:hypothetical protein
VVRQGAEACAQARPQDKGCFDLSGLHPHLSVFFIPNSGSILIRATTMNPGMVERMIQKKKF